MLTKLFLKIWLLSVSFEKLTSRNLWGNQSQHFKRSTVIGPPPHQFIEVNFSKLMDSNQIFRNNFVSIHCHLGEIACQVIGCKFFWDDT